MNLDPFVPGVRPYAMSAEDKARFLEERLTALREYHRQRCEGYAALVEDAERTAPAGTPFIERYPFLPVSLFKEYELRSRNDDVSVVQSSATTSANASKIFVDKESRRRQARSANAILSDFIGEERRPYLVFDTEATVRSSNGFSARGAAILAVAHLATEFHFVMRQTADRLELDRNALAAALDKIAGRPFIAYGFTYILYQAHVALADFAPAPAHPGSVLLHSGGWKRLQDLAVDKSTFNRTVAGVWGLPPDRVIDFYGMVEQVGLAYPDCPEGVKHVPYWAEVLIRRADTLDTAEPGEPGLIQLISTLPLASPNHSVLTEDIGRIERLDGCPCGRRGTAFVFQGRAPKSELRGCSDVVRR